MARLEAGLYYESGHGRGRARLKEGSGCWAEGQTRGVAWLEMGVHLGGGA